MFMQWFWRVKSSQHVLGRRDLAADLFNIFHTVFFFLKKILAPTFNARLMNMSKAKKIVVFVASAATLLGTIAPAYAGCVWDDRGSPHADGGSATQLMRTQHAHNTWQDWFWRGSWEGKVFQCPWGNADPTCPINLDFTKGTSHSAQIQFGFDAGGGTNDWFKKAVGSLAASFNYSKQRTWNNSFSFRPGGSIRRGQKAEPITVQDRRWQRGYYRGGWVQTGSRTVTSGRLVVGVQRCYDFQNWHNFGGWTTNQAEGSSFHTIHITG